MQQLGDSHVEGYPNHICSLKQMFFFQRNGAKNLHFVTTVLTLSEERKPTPYFSFFPQACEHRGPGPVPKQSWGLYLLGAQRCKKLGISERSEAFSPDHDPGSEFHSTFIHMLQDSMSVDVVAQARESHYLFVSTVQSLLCSSRPLIFS